MKELSEILQTAHQSDPYILTLWYIISKWTVLMASGFQVHCFFSEDCIRFDPRVFVKKIQKLFWEHSLHSNKPIFSFDANKNMRLVFGKLNKEMVLEHPSSSIVVFLETKHKEVMNLKYNNIFQEVSLLQRNCFGNTPFLILVVFMSCFLEGGTYG